MTDFLQGADAKPANYYRHARKEMLPNFPAEFTRVLDVGCGSNRFGELSRDTFLGTEIWGVEPVDEAHAAASNVVKEIGGINPCWLSWKFRLLRALMPQLSDLPFQQFALRAVKPLAGQ